MALGDSGVGMSSNRYCSKPTPTEGSLVTADQRVGSVGWSEPVFVEETKEIIEAEIRSFIDLDIEGEEVKGGWGALGQAEFY